LQRALQGTGAVGRTQCSTGLSSKHSTSLQQSRGHGENQAEDASAGAVCSLGRVGLKMRAVPAQACEQPGPDG
jgi:hypothetical protein